MVFDISSFGGVLQLKKGVTAYMAMKIKWHCNIEYIFN